MLAGLTQEERSNLLLTVGTHKDQRKISPIEVASLVAKACQHQSLENVAQDLELRDTSVLRRFISLLSLPPEVQNLVGWGGRRGTISFTVAAEISRVADNKTLKSLAYSALEYNLSRNEVRAVIQRTERAGVDISAALHEILKLRPEVERQFLFVGSFNERIVRRQSGSELQRTLRRRLSELIGAKNVLSVSCKSGRFLILMTEEGASNQGITRSLTQDELEPFVSSLVNSD